MKMTLATSLTHIYSWSSKLQKGGSEMEQKVVVILGSVVATGLVTMGIILAARMPKEATAGAFSTLVNATARGLAIAENSTC